MNVRREASCGMSAVTATVLIAAAACGAVGCAGEGLLESEAVDGAQEAAVEPLRRAPSRQLADDTRFFTPAPNPGQVRQFVELVRQRRLRDAARIAALATTPHAAWFTQGTPGEVRSAVRKTMRDAGRANRVPVLVAYNVPFRDCSQYSAGGAAGTAEYLAWVDGFARGIGNDQAVVILEPDGLGIIPHHTDLNGNPEWCQPADADPATAAADRYAELNAALDRLLQQPNVSVYLDGTHSRWLGVGDAAQRLVRAGLERAQGFFLNVSNYQATEQVEKYGSWISSCVAFASNPEEGGWRLGRYEWCASQYFPASIDDPNTWAQSDAWYADNLGTAVPTAHFVVDTSRNGQGAWRPDPAAGYPDPQDWCNPPGRGAGLRPTANTGSDLLDAHLWIKVPGESDGLCNRGVPGSTTDPEWGGIVDPAAGEWFPAQALELAKLATPPLL